MPPTRSKDQRPARRHALAAAAYMMQSVATATALYASTWYWKQPHHNSALTGDAWVRELINGHPDRIRIALGMRLHVFLALVAELRLSGLCESKHVTLEEQVAIFLYTCVTGLSIRHVGERFQHSNDTISKYFRQVLLAVSSPPFYTKYVYLPSADSTVPIPIYENPKWYPFFDGAIGAMDGSHFAACPSAADRHAVRNRKGGLSQNCLACCSFDMRFQYMLSGWEGSAADASLYHNARTSDLQIPNGRYYLADGGFSGCDALLVPYRGVRYHLSEWGRAGVRPVNREELFNLRHASARNVIERIFGVIKKRWNILNHAPEYSMDIQAHIPPASASIHNFIMEYDPDDILSFGEAIEDPFHGQPPAEQQEDHHHRKRRIELRKSAMKLLKKCGTAISNCYKKDKKIY
ncbi:hypothetical protein ONZ45_g1366 [Pleurotus djamor]|nr:hypothetical protein ONZ45_g1366 [Pleurotus djamor]